MEKVVLVYHKDLTCETRLDKFIASELEDCTRSLVQIWVKDKNVFVNGKNEKNNYILKDNDEIVVNIPEAESVDVTPEDIPLDVYYEDEDIIIVNKPSGMVVHPGSGNYTHTLVNALMFHCKDLSGINGEIRAGIVHRIDKDTSGLLVACKNDLSHKELSKDFSEKNITRKYLALVHGVIPHNQGKIDAPIGRHPIIRQQMAVVDGGKHAVTHFKVLERFSKYTLCEMKLETGRTHQIRVHMKYIGYPLVGDPVYGPRNVVGDHGQFLHAKVLGLNHPRTKEYIEFECPLPEYYEEFLEELRKEEK